MGFHRNRLYFGNLFFFICCDFSIRSVICNTVNSLGHLPFLDLVKLNIKKGTCFEALVWISWVLAVSPWFTGVMVVTGSDFWSPYSSCKNTNSFLSKNSYLMARDVLLIIDALLEELLQFSAWVWWLTTTCKSSSAGFDICFCISPAYISQTSPILQNFYAKTFKSFHFLHLGKVLFTLTLLSHSPQTCWLAAAWTPPAFPSFPLH